MGGSLFRLGGWKPARPTPPVARPRSAFRSGSDDDTELQARIDADPRFTAPGPEDDWWKGEEASSGA
jgi:hypothetical protein